ncbi:WD40 repeat-like protein [Coniophora puteana RWD-64-598 SS2]|uniref:WD40 repeat-like protein n=1 Tax=Coniophora puteana (strain RWD-64-598) TaxID=741705 RepID=A0A5M3MV86_CONPW|nr:WD40 repeat-like protein [Coniophora puteana RWD-64-598 SS2]EIW83036.1 WD40 repeat-like protein [Coniophora puteana RWD-64-598 SS2]
MSTSSRTLTNSVHPPGKTCLAFSMDGKYAYTGGSDSIVRIFHVEKGKDQEPDAAAEAEDNITALTAANECWLSASEDSYIRTYTAGKNTFNGLAGSVKGATINCIAVDPKGKRIAVASDELMVKISDLDNISNVQIVDGFKRGVRKVTWDPSGSLLTVSCGDGTIAVWDVSEEQPTRLEVIDGIIPAVTDSESEEFMHDCSAVWHPTGQRFYAASRTHDIVAISRATWTKSETLSDPSVTGSHTAIALSANGAFLASACGSEVLIWSTQKRRVLSRLQSTPSAVTIQLAFSPSQNLLAWIDTQGGFTRVSNAIATEFGDPIKDSAAANVQGQVISRKKTPTPWEDDADVDLDAVGGDDGLFGGEDWIIDDIGGGMQDKPERQDKGDGYVKEMVSITKAQSAFQPGSTPMSVLKRRYLAYNMIGVIEVTDQDTHHIVNVEFHDRSARKSYHFTDHFKHDLASSGERGAVFACPPEQDNPAQVIYKPYGVWSTQGEWTYILPKGQRVLGVAAGGNKAMKSLRENSDSGGDLQGHGNVVVATSAGDLTFISGSGVEQIILGLEGEFVTMAAAEEYVIVVHRPGATTIDGSQGLLATVISYEDFEVLQEKPLPIPKGHILKWIGITDQGIPAIYDSAGYLHIMINFRRPNRATWARLLDTNAWERKQGKDESYWPVGCSNETFHCLILKGRQEYPGFPRPLIQELPIRMPFRIKDTTEEELLRIHINLARDALPDDEVSAPDLDRRELELDKITIRLIQAACKTDKQPRALELAKRLNLPQSLAAAHKVAAFYKLHGLREKFEALIEWREETMTPAEEARERRRALGDEDAPMAMPKPFQDFNAPPRVDRPGLARPTGIVEHSEFSSSNAGLRPIREKATGLSMSRSASPEGKRKRDEDDHMLNGTESDVKRRALGDAPSPATNSSTIIYRPLLILPNSFYQTPSLERTLRQQIPTLSHESPI